MLNGRQIVGLKSGLLALSLAFTLVFVFVGFGNHMDAFYWMDLIARRDFQLMACGTIALGSVWTQVFGLSIVSLRCLAWLCCATAIALPYVCLLDSRQRRDNLHWLALAYLLMGYGTYQEYSPGSLSMLALTATAVVWMKYRNNRRWVWLLPVVMSIAIAARFPNVLLLIAVPLLIVLDAWAQHKSWQRVGTDLLILLAGTGLLTCGIYAMLTDLFSGGSMAQSVGAYADDSHSFGTMITTVWDKAIYPFRKMVVLTIAGVLLWGISFLRSRAWRIAADCLVALAMTGYIVAKCPIDEWYNNPLNYLLAALVIVPTLFLSIRALIQRDYATALAFVSLIFIGAIEPMGSDTGWMKLFPMYIVFVPYVFTHFTFCRSQQPFVLVPIVMYALTVFVCNPIGVDPLYQCKVQREEPVLKRIYMSEQRSNYIDRLLSDYAAFSEQGEVFVMGDGLHLMHALTGCAKHYNQFFALRDKPEFVAQQMAYIAVHQPVVMFVYTPEFIYPTKGHGNSLMEQQLLDNGYSRIARTEDTYYVYVPTKTQE